MKKTKLYLLLGISILCGIVGCNAKKTEPVQETPKRTLQPSPFFKMAHDMKAESKSAAEIPVAEERNRIKIERKGNTLVIRNLNYSLAEALADEDMEGVEVLGLIHCETQYFSRDFAVCKDIKVLSMVECGMINVDFLDFLPNLEMFEGHLVSMPGNGGEIDLSKLQKLAYFSLTHNMKPLHFKKIKALPSSLEVFNTDASFDMSNLPELQAQGNPLLHFSVATGETSELVAQGVQIKTEYDGFAADWRDFERRYALDAGFLNIK